MLKQWSAKVEGVGNDGNKATYEAIVNASSAVEAADIVNRKMRGIYWRETAFKFKIEQF